MVVKVDEWREANMQLFLIESAQSGSLTVLHSGLDQDHLWCLLKKGASSAGTQGECCSISLHISKIVVLLCEAFYSLKRIWALGITAIYGLNMDGDKS